MVAGRGLIVRQRFTSSPGGTELEAEGESWIEVGAEGLWADYRAGAIVALLRSIVDALAQQNA